MFIAFIFEIVFVLCFIRSFICIFGFEVIIEVASFGVGFDVIGLAL